MAVNNSLSTKNQRVGLTAYLTNDAVKNQINNVIGGKNGQRFISSIISAVQTNPALQECSNSSILSSALLGESLKLSPSPQLGHYYLVPFNDNKRGCKVAQFQIGYKGLLQLAIRSGQYKKINVVAIKEGELVRFDPLNEEIVVNLIEDEEEREKAETIGYYAMFEYTNGFRKAIYWSKAKMLAHADKYSAAFSRDGGNFGRDGKFHRVSFADYKAGNYDKDDEWMYSSFWYKDFDGMAYKTMLRQLISKWGIMSIDMQTAIDSDMAVINEDGTRDYVDTVDNEIVSDAVESHTEPNNEPTEATETANDVESALFGGEKDE